MKIFDISREVLSCNFYPGDPIPSAERIKSIENGEYKPLLFHSPDILSKEVGYLIVYED